MMDLLTVPSGGQSHSMPEQSQHKKMKLSPKFDVVLENIARYSEAGSKGGGNCAVKYIFHEDNSNDDDMLGFCYAMLALRPQEAR